MNEQLELEQLQQQQKKIDYNMTSILHQFATNINFLLITV